MSEQTAISQHLLAIIEAQTEIARAARDRTTLMDRVVRYARSLTGAETAAVGVIEGDALRYTASSGRLIPKDLRVPLDSSLAGECVRRGQFLISADTEIDPRVHHANAQALEARSLVVAPLFDLHRPVGVLYVSSTQPNAFGAHAAETLQLISGLLGAALGQATAFAEKTRAEAEARGLADQLGAVLSAVTESAITGVDLEGNITFFSRGAERMLGYRADEVTGERPIRFHDPEEVRIAVDAAGGSAPEAFIGDALRGEPFTREWTYIRKDGSRLTVELTLTPMRDAAGVLTGFISVATDITERKAVDTMKDEFISIVSHELRTPLTGIRGSLGLLASGLLGDMSPKATRMLEIALGNTDRLIRLVSDMLDIERMQSGKVTLELVECNVSDLVLEAAEAVRPVADRTGIRIDCSAAQDLQINADPDRMVQVLTNLLSNAVKFSHSGSTVTVSSYPTLHDTVRIDVRDQGRGIPGDQLERIFERFRQVDASDSREKGGTGLGLAICRMIVSQHGGHIWAESTPGAGTTVCVELAHT